jgi:hypothetical protein
MAPEKSEQESSDVSSEIAPDRRLELDRAERSQREALTTEPSSSEIFSVDDRLIVLERHDREHRQYLLQFQDALVDQIIAVGVLELVFAILLAMNVWGQYRKLVVVNGANEG